MKTIPNRTLYRCDYCRTHRLSPAAAQHHERFCKHNPNNKHKCFGCQYLTVADGVGSDGQRLKSFTCEALNLPLYSYVAEKRGVASKYGLLPEGCKRMPLTCPAYRLKLIGAPENLPF